MTETVTVRKDDLRALMAHAAAAPQTDEGELRLRELLARCGEALNGTGGDAPPFAAAATPVPGTAPGAAAAPAYPPGEFSRVELPGYVSWTGWVAEETYAGAGVLVVRDISGTVRARVSASAFRQVVPLPLPEPGDCDGQLELTAGDDEPGWDDGEGGEGY